MEGFYRESKEDALKKVLQISILREPFVEE
jgi:hypothetical protein